MSIWVLTALLWYSTLAALNLPLAWMPDFALAISIWAGLQVLREGDDRDLYLAIGLGLCAGILSVEPWTIKALTCLIATALTAVLRRQIVPQTAQSRWTLALAVAILILAFDWLCRAVLPSLTWPQSSILELLAKAGLTASLVLVVSTFFKHTSFGATNSRLPMGWQVNRR